MAEARRRFKPILSKAFESSQDAKPELPERQALEIPETPQSEAPLFASDARDLGEATTVSEPPLATTPDQPDYDT